MNTTNFIIVILLPVTVSSPVANTAIHGVNLTYRRVNIAPWTGRLIRLTERLSVWIEGMILISAMTQINLYGLCNAKFTCSFFFKVFTWCHYELHLHDLVFKPKRISPKTAFRHLQHICREEKPYIQSKHSTVSLVPLSLFSFLPESKFFCSFKSVTYLFRSLPNISLKCSNPLAHKRVLTLLPSEGRA